MIKCENSCGSQGLLQYLVRRFLNFKHFKFGVFLTLFLLRFILYIQELLLAEEWAKKNNVKFPPIDAVEQFEKHGMKEFYLFRHPTDPSCPIVMHFVMVNLTFREESAPGKNLQLLRYVLSKIF